MKLTESMLRKMIKEQVKNALLESPNDQYAEKKVLIEGGAGMKKYLRQERAAVVAWLREVAETMNHNGDKCFGRVEDLADAVARGEHRREEEK